NCETTGNDLIYVVSDSYQLMSFDPSELPDNDPFTPIGQLNCPAGTPWPGYSSPATPFSMSVDRDGSAWVLYTSGEIFKASIADASCTATGFAPGQHDMQLFGMGFASDTAGSDAETLFIAGGMADLVAD